MRKSSLRLYAPFIAIALVQALFIAVAPSKPAGRQEVAAGPSFASANGANVRGADTAVGYDAGGTPIDANGVPVSGGPPGGPGSTVPGGGPAPPVPGGGPAPTTPAGDTSHCTPE